MKYKTKQVTDRFVEILSGWPGVECIVLNEAAEEDTLAPYFALILDVYCTAPMPDPAARERLYGEEIRVFETQGTGALSAKDRFLLGDIPVRMEYKTTGHADELVAIAREKPDFLWLIKDSGTYGYYRLAQGAVLFNRTHWIDRVRAGLAELPGTFWRALRGAHQSKMEHLLNDLGAAFFQGDDFNYLISSALFIKELCLTLFCINRRFEPSHKAYYTQVLGLPVLPESFQTRFDRFLDPASQLTLEQRFALAQALALSVIIL